MRFSTAVSMLAFLTFATPALAAEDYVIMKVNNQDVAASDATRFWEGLFPQGQAPAFDSVKQDMRDKVLRGVLAERLLLSEATKQGIDKSEVVQRQLEEIRKKLIVKTFLDTKTADSISEADLKKEYDTVVGSMKDEREVHARHILVASEQEAKDLRKKIEDGKSFEEIATGYSKDAGSAKQGGDLGYFTKDKMVKEFADAAFALKKNGDISQPVKSGFGWHIIKLEDSRKVPAPAFADVKEQLRAKLQEKKLNDYVATLVKTADVKVFDSKGKAIAFEKNMPTDKPVKEEKKKAEKKPENKAASKPEAKEDSAAPAEGAH